MNSREICYSINPMKTIQTLIALARSSCYNEENKANWKKESMSFLRRIAKELNLTKGDYSIRFNPGGIVVSGEATLHHNSFYLQIGEFGGFWRECDGQRDFCGKSNRNFNTWGFERDFTADQLIESIRSKVFPAGPTHGTQAGGDGKPGSPLTICRMPILRRSKIRKIPYRQDEKNLLGYWGDDSSTKG